MNFASSPTVFLPHQFSRGTSQKQARPASSQGFLGDSRGLEAWRSHLAGLLGSPVSLLDPGTRPRRANSRMPSRLESTESISRNSQQRLLRSSLQGYSGPAGS